MADLPLLKQIAQKLLGNGMLGQDAKMMQAHPAYLDYAEEMQRNGYEPLQFPEWYKQQMQQAQQKLQDQVGKYN